MAAQQFASNQQPPDRSREVLLKFVKNYYFQSSISPSMLPRILSAAFQIWSSKPISAVLSLAIVVEILYKGSNFSRESKKTITTTFWGGGVFSGWYYNRWLLDVDSDIFITILHLFEFVKCRMRYSKHSQIVFCSTQKVNMQKSILLHYSVSYIYHIFMKI